MCIIKPRICICGLVDRQQENQSGQAYPIQYYLQIMMQSSSSPLSQPASLLKAIIICLNQLLQDTSPSDTTSLFNLKAQPTISLADYLTRMYKYMNCSISVFIYSLILIDRAQEYNPLFVVNKRNIHRLLLAANIVSAKYLDDVYYKNSFYANIGGVTVKILNELQMELLELLNFEVHVGNETFNAYLERLELFVEINHTKEAVKENQETKIEKSRPLMKNKNQSSIIKQNQSNAENSSTQNIVQYEKEKEKEKPSSVKVENI